MKTVIFAAALTCAGVMTTAEAQEAPEAVAQADAHEPAAGRVVSDEFVADALSAKISRDVEERLRERQDFYWGLAAAAGTLFIGFFGFIGLGQLQGMRRQIREGLFSELQQSILSNEDFRSAVERNVAQRLQNETKEQLSQVTQQVALNRLASLAAKVEAGTRFSDYEKDALMDGLFVLKDSPTIIASNEFKESLRNILKSFNNADLDSEIDKIHETLGAALLEGDFWVALPLMLNYAERVLGSSNPTATEKDRFVRYTSACKRAKQYEDALPYLMVAAESGKLRDLNIPEYRELKQDFSHLTEDEKARFGHILFGPILNERPAGTGRRERFREAFRAFHEKHGNEFAKWRPPETNPET